jgi:FtsH-binding integral membrane protein
MSSLLQSIFKKDDDARALQDNAGNIYIETDQPLVTAASMVDDASKSMDTFVKETVLNDHILEDAIVEPIADIRVKTVMYMFMANAAVMLLWFLVGGTLYYWNMVWSNTASAIVMGIAAAFFVFCYILMLYIRTTHTTLALVSLCGWAVSGSVMIGGVASLSHKVAPIQLVLLILMQCFAMMAYTKLSPRFISTLHSMAYMFVVTLVVWALFIFAFVQERDWVGGILILVVAFGIIGYHGWQIRIVEGRYSLSWPDIQLSIIQFYGDIILEPATKFCAK